MQKVENNLNEVKDKPQIININNNNNKIVINGNVDFMTFTTPENIKDIFEKHFNIKVLKAEEGFADFTVENFLSGDDRPLYICTDGQRNRFSFFDKGDIIRR